ncbi:MAG: hypothetical protein GX846_09650 [Deltaproteobacteria bacterium]|nr:hypothetical protein [Deltaproteobacteria bacterium]
MFDVSHSIKNLKKMLLLFVFTMIVLQLPNNALARENNEELKARIERLEKELAELKAILTEKAPDAEKPSAPIKEAARPSSGFEIKSYGYIKLDASYNDSRTVNGNYVLYVPSEGTVKNDNTFNITARQSRLGFNITAPQYQGWVTKAKVEADFYGDGTMAHENKAELMLRHAFLETTKGGLSFLAGQTSDVISPLIPNSLSYVPGFASGNIGYRRPQVRVSYNSPLNESTCILTQFALSRTTGTTNEDLDKNNQNDGDDAGFPTMQARIALTTKGLAGKKNTIGISGHFGREEMDWEGVKTDHNSWSGNIDFIIPLSERLTLSGELFTGKNLDDYFGGILQGINTATRNEISSTGMWSQINFAFNNEWQYNAGFSFEDPDTDDIASQSRDKNSFYFINAMFRVHPMLTIGLEYNYYKTEYKGLADGTVNRLQTSAIFTW